MVFMEDVFDEYSFEEFAEARNAIPESIIAGDDLTVTSPNCMKQDQKIGAIEGFLFKTNQVGTISRATEALTYAKNNA